MYRTFLFVTKQLKFFNHYLHLLTLYQIMPIVPKIPPCPCPVECRKMSISSTRTYGAYFSFFGRSRQQAETPVHLSYSSSRNNNLITIYRNILHIILSLIPNNSNNSINTSPIGNQHYYFLTFLVC